MKKMFLFMLLTTATIFATAQQFNSSAKVNFKNGASSTGWMDFDFYNDNQIFLKASINGHEAAILLVNSIGASRIDTDFATSIGVAPAVGGSTPSATVVIQFGNLTLGGVNANISQSKSTGHARNFILSDDLFNNLIADIDFAHHRIAFYDPATFRAPKGAVALPFIQGTDSRSVPVSIDDAAPEQFELFLGDPAPVTIYQAFYQAHGLLQNRPTSVRLGGGAGKHPREATATITTVQFAGVGFAQVPGVFPTDSVRGTTATDVSGNIGTELLARFRVILDYSHNLLYAIPNPKAANAAFTKDRSGLFLIEKDGAYTVEFVAPGSPAEKGGFKAGETVTSINQKPVKDLQGTAWQRAALGSLKETPAGVTYSFTMADGSVRQLVTADFF
jgi:hypothetical protein